MLRSLGVYILVMFVSAAAHAASTTYTLQANYWLRARPAADGPGLELNSKPIKVSLVATQAGAQGSMWALVSTGKTKYWVSFDGLTPKPRVAPSVPTFNALNDNSPIRNAPGTKDPNSRIVDSVSAATSLELIEAVRDADGDTWYHVKYLNNGNLRQGYIYEGKVRAESDAGSEAGNTCPTGNCPHTNVNAGILNAAQVSATVSADTKGFSLPSARYNSSCGKFINGAGLGTYGRAMINAIEAVGAHACFYDRSIFFTVCPKFQKMNPSQKREFIALLFASIAQQESGCEPNAQTRGVNDTADGLFQLEYHANTRYNAGRNRRFCHTQDAVNTEDLTFQSQCAVSTVKDAICAHSVEITSDSYGYWQELQGNGRITRNLIRTAKEAGLCH